MAGARDQAGFTLLEVLAAAAILAVSLVAVSGIFTHGLLLTGGARDELVAAELAQARLEELKAEGVEGMLARQVDGHPYLLPPDQAGDAELTLEQSTRTLAGRAFTRRVVAQWITGGDPPREPPATLLRVTVTVTWPTPAGEREFALDTLLAKRGSL